MLYKNMELIKMNTFGFYLKKVRIEKGYTQASLAQKMGVSHVFINTYENDKRNPKPDTIKKFKEALNCSYEELGLIKDQFGIYDLPGTETSFIPSKDSLFETKNQEINCIIDYLNDNGKQKVIDYIEDIKVNPKYKNNDL